MFQILNYIYRIRIQTAHLIKTIIVLVICVSFSDFSFGQEIEQDSTRIFEIADTSPEPIGGMNAIYEWFSQKLSEIKLDHTDTLDCSSRKNGRVLVTFLISKDGKLINPEIVYGLGEPYDQFCLNLVAKLPIEWSPGTYKGNPVNVKAGIPFNFCQ